MALYGWYHGKVSRVDAEHLISGGSSGTFVVRNGSGGGGRGDDMGSHAAATYVVTFTDGARVRHVRIERLLGAAASPTRRFKSGDETYADVEGCVNHLKTHGALSTHVDALRGPATTARGADAELLAHRRERGLAK
mmetsp:Transcript_30016/g.73113  ORF Transcript_30016/g.73113 Transcript_30016/m.73113 type:complete len:136 (+) Transcript_30016:316-723(+)